MWPSLWAEAHITSKMSQIYKNVVVRRMYSTGNLGSNRFALINTIKSASYLKITNVGLCFTSWVFQ